MSAQLQKEYFDYYENVMKPLFYNFKGLYDDIDCTNNQDEWQCYKTLNQKFSAKIIDVKDKHETEESNIFIWLNNNQLFMVPSYLRRVIRDSHIGLYIHSPFPSSDIFRMFAYRNELLKSILE